MFYIPLSSSESDLRIREEVDVVFEKIKFDGVIHCATKVGGLGGNMNYKGEFFYDNIIINTNVIESTRKAGVEKLVDFLSTCVFPNDVQIKAYREQYGLNYTSVIPTNIYGINDNFNTENGHVIPSLIHKCYIAKETNTPLVIWGSGKPLREFIYNKDVTKLTEWVLENYNENEPIILSTSEEISIKDVVDMISELMNFKGEIIFDSTKPNGQYRKPSDNSKIKNYLPDFKFIPLYDGLKETINWSELNYKTIRGTKHIHYN